MDLNRLVKDLEEIKDCIENDHIEKAEDLLGFVIGEVNIAAQQSVQATAATSRKTGKKSTGKVARKSRRA